MEVGGNDNLTKTSVPFIDFNTNIVNVVFHHIGCAVMFVDFIGSVSYFGPFIVNI